MKILFVHINLSSFTRLDLESLRLQHEVHEMHVRCDSIVTLAYSIVRILRGVRRTDLVFVWFGSFHAFIAFAIAKLWRKPCIVVAGGYDVAAIDEISYGNMRPGLRRWIGRRAFAMADRILVFSKHAEMEALRNAGADPCKVRVLYLGVPDVAATDLDRPRERQVITVGSVNASTIQRKGLLTFVEAAHLVPDARFVMIGPWEDDSVEVLRARAPDNVTVTGRVSDDELRQMMQRSSVYVQVSVHEGFGMALAEAMAMGCIPVVTDRGSLPEVAGVGGYYVPFGDPHATADAIRQALGAGAARRHLVREHIVDQFSLATRRQQLEQELILFSE